MFVFKHFNVLTCVQMDCFKCCGKRNELISEAEQQNITFTNIQNKTLTIVFLSTILILIVKDKLLDFP